MRAAIGAIIEQCRDFGYILNENFSEIPYETYSAGKLEDLMLVFAQELQTNAYNQALEDAIRVASGYQQLGKPACHIIAELATQLLVLLEKLKD